MAVVRIDPAIELDTPRGRARAHFLIDYGELTSLCWVTFLADSGECWSFRNRDVRLAPCETFGVRMADIDTPAQLISSLSESNDTLNGDVESLRLRLQAADALERRRTEEMDTLRGQLRDYEASYKVLEDELDCATSEYNAARGQLAEMGINYAKLQEERITAENQTRDLRHRLSEARVRITTLEDSIAGLPAPLAEPPGSPLQPPAPLPSAYLAATPPGTAGGPSQGCGAAVQPPAPAPTGGAADGAVRQPRWDSQLERWILEA